MTPPRGYRPIFGPVHNCPNCGHPVQYVKRRGLHNHREEADTGLTHYCKVEPPVVVPFMTEFPIGRNLRGTIDL